MTRFSDQLKANYEYETIAYFINFTRDAGGPAYELVRFQERPDTIIMSDSDQVEVGAEITRIVTPDDAIARRAIGQMRREFERRLSAVSEGGAIELYSGSCPDFRSEGLARLFSSFDAAVDAAGGVRLFVNRLPEGVWEFGGTRFRFIFSDSTPWKARVNAVQLPLRSHVDPEELNELLLSRIRAKVSAAAKYPWSGPLFLIVRNTYQPFMPTRSTYEEIARLDTSVFDQMWVVNHRENVVDASPPQPRLVHLA